MLLVIGVTGSVLVFKTEIDRLLAPERVLAPEPDAPRLGPDAIFAAAQEHLPDQIVMGWGKALQPDMADVVYAVEPGEEDGKLIRVDPATGRPLVGGFEEAGTFTDWMLELHYTLLAGHAGELVVGLLGVLLCLLGVSGIYLYRGFWKTFFQLRWNKSARILFSDAHKMIGITSVVFNLLLGFTGAWWNLSHILGHAFEEEHEHVTMPKWTGAVAIDPLLEEARGEIPGYETNWISLPFEPGGDIGFFGAIEGQSVFRSPYGSTVFFDGGSGELKFATPVGELGAWAQAVDAFRPLHFGTFGGVPVKILWCLAGLTPGALAVTGTVMWWQRTRRRRRKPLAQNS